MNPEERAAYLKSLYDSAAQTEYQNKIQTDLEEQQSMRDNWEYYQKQYSHEKNNMDQLGETDYDWNMKKESDRLGTTYIPGSEYNQQNLYEHQGYGEQIRNAGGRYIANTIFDTVGGIAAMADLPGYWDPNSAIFKGITDWAAEQKQATNEYLPIYQSKDAGMYGPGSISWWIENGSSLASSASSFALQGAALGKAMQGVKWLASLNKIGKIDDVARVGPQISTGETLAQVGKSGDQIKKGLERGDLAREAISATALTQSAAIMSATETYNTVYDEAIAKGYGDEYAKSIAAQSASNVVNMSRANILLNMSSANRFLGGSKNIQSLKPESFKKAALKEMPQEFAEEHIEEIAQKQAELGARESLDQGTGPIKMGGVPGLGGYKNLPLLSGNVYGDATWKELGELSVLAVLGAAGQTGLTEGVYKNIGGQKFLGGITNRFGSQTEQRHTTNQYYPDGSIKAYAGDPIYEMEDVMVKDEKTGEMKPDYIESEFEKDPETGEPVKEIRQQVKLDDKGQPIVKMTDAKFSQNELENQQFERISNTLTNFQQSVEKNVSTIATAKYQRQLDIHISDINDVIDEGKGQIGDDRKAKLIDDMARIEMVHSGTTEFDSAESKDQLEAKKKELAASFDTMSERDLRKKQDELLKFSLARTAVESFENNTKDHLIEVFNELKKMTPEQAKERGYTPDYREKIDESIKDIDTYYNRWMEYNTKRSGGIARALFNNRLKSDIVLKEIEDLDNEAKLTHDKSVKDHASKNDIDLNEVKEGGTEPNKAKFDQAFKIEQAKNKEILSDAKLKELEKEQNRLQDELDKLSQTDDTVAGFNKPAHIELSKSKIKELEKASKVVNDRKKELSKPYDEMIKALGVGKFKTGAQTDIYNKKLKAVEQTKELDKIFDELASAEGEARLKKLQYEEALKAAKRRAFLMSMRQLMDVQDKGGGIYWVGGIPGKLVWDKATSNYTFVITEEEPFITRAEESDKYENVIRPGAEQEVEAEQKESRDRARQQIKELNEALTKAQNELTPKLAREAELKTENINLSTKVEDPAYKTKAKTLMADDVERRKAIDNINRINRLLGRPEIMLDMTTDSVIKQEEVLLREIRKELGKAEAEVNKIQDEISSTEESIGDARDIIIDNKIPEKFRFFNVIPNGDAIYNDDGSIKYAGSISVSVNKDFLEPVINTVTRKLDKYKKYGFKSSKDQKGYSNVSKDTPLKKGDILYDLTDFRKSKGKKKPVLIGTIVEDKPAGQEEYKLGVEEKVKSTKPIVIPLDYDSLSYLRFFDKATNDVHKAQRAYLRAYNSKIVRIGNLTQERIKLYADTNDDEIKLREANAEILKELNQLNKLRDFVISNGLNKSNLDFTDPIANQLNSIIASFHTENTLTMIEEAANLKKSIERFSKDITRYNKQIKEVDSEIDDVKAKILKHKTALKSGKKSAKGAHARWLKTLNKALNKAQSTKASLTANLEFRESQIAKYEAYMTLVNKNKYNVGFVKNELNKLALPIEQINADLAILQEGIDALNSQLEHIDSRISYSKTLQDEILKVMIGRDRYNRNRDRMLDLIFMIRTSFTEAAKEKYSEIVTEEEVESDKGKKAYFDTLISNFEDRVDKIFDDMDTATMFKMLDGLGIDEDSDTSKLIDELDRLNDDTNSLLETIDYKSNLTDQQLQDEFDQLQDLLRNDLREQEIVYAFLGDSEQQLAELQAKADRLNSVSAGSIYLLSRLDRKLDDNKNKHQELLNEQVNNLTNKLNDTANANEGLLNKLAKFEQQRNELAKEYELLVAANNTLVESYEEFMTSEDPEFINKVVKEINGTVDKNGNNKMLQELEAEINLLDAEINAGLLNINDLDNLMHLRMEFITALQLNDTDLSDQSLQERKAIIDKLMEGNELTKQLDGARQGMLMNENAIDRSANIDREILSFELLQNLRDNLAKDTKPLHEKRATAATELKIARLIFNDVQKPLVKESKIKAEDNSSKETADEKKINEGLSSDGAIVEENHAEAKKSLDPWQRSKDSIFTNVPRHIEFNKGRVFDKDGLPVMSNNPNDLRHMLFMNTFIGNPDSLLNDYKVEFVSLSKSLVNKEYVNLNDLIKDFNITDKKTIDLLDKLVNDFKSVKNSTNVPTNAQEIVEKSVAGKSFFKSKDLLVHVVTQLRGLGYKIATAGIPATDVIRLYIDDTNFVDFGMRGSTGTLTTFEFTDSDVQKKLNDSFWPSGVESSTNSTPTITVKDIKNKVASISIGDKTFDIPTGDVQLGTARDENEPLNNNPTYQKDQTVSTSTALEEDIKSPGIYAVIVTKDGERVYINNNGEISIGTQPDGYFPVFTTVPNPSKFDKTTMGENMLARKLGELTGSHGKLKLAQFNEKVKIGNQSYSTTDKQVDGTLPLESLKELLINQIKADIDNFRRNVTDSINDGKKVYSDINDISNGDLLYLGEGKTQSAAWLFEDSTFKSIVKTKEAKGTETGVKVNDKNVRLISGIPYVLSNDGSLVPFDTNHLNNNDVDLVMRLITELVPSKNKWNSTQEYPVIDSDDTKKVRLVSSKDKGVDNIGLLNKLINWGGAEKKPFSIYLKSGYVNFVNKDGKHDYFPVESLIEYIEGGQDISKVKSKFGRASIPNFITFLKEKKRHVNFKLINPDNIGEKYYHPVLVDGEVKLQEYDNYKEYLKGIAITDTLNPTQLNELSKKTGMSITSPVVGKYFEFSRSISDGKDLIPINNIILNNLNILEGDRLERNGVVNTVVRKDDSLYWDDELLTPENINEFSFYIVKPTKSKTKSKAKSKSTDKNKNKDKKTEADEDTEISVDETFIAAFEIGDKLTFANPHKSLTLNSQGKKELADNGVQITAVKPNDKTLPEYLKGKMLVNYNLRYEPENDLLNLNEFYYINDDGTITRITDNEDISKVKIHFNIPKSIDIVDIDSINELYPDGTGDYWSKDPGQKANFRRMFGSELDSLPKLAQYIEARFREIGGNNNIVAANNMLLGNEFFNKYLPYIITGNKDLVSNLVFQKSADGSFDKIGLSGVGKQEIVDQQGVSTISENLVEYNTENPTKLSELLDDKTLFPGKNNAYLKLIKQLFADEDSDLGIKYLPWIHEDASYKKTSTDEELSITLGSIVRNNTTGKKLAATLAHELIHRMDKSGKIDYTSETWKNLENLRDETIDYLLSTEGKKNAIWTSPSLRKGDEEFNALVYWMFGKMISEEDVRNAKSSSKTKDEFIEALGLSENDINQSMSEFFANVLNQSTFQKFLNNTDLTSLKGYKRTAKVTTLFDKFIELLSKLFGIDIRDKSVLKEVLTIGAQHYKNHGYFREYNDVIVHEDAEEEVEEDTESETEEEFDDEIDELDEAIEDAKESGDFAKVDELTKEKEAKVASKTEPVKSKDEVLSKADELLDSLGMSMPDLELNDYDSFRDKFFNIMGESEESFELIYSELSDSQIDKIKDLSDDQIIEKLNELLGNSEAWSLNQSSPKPSTSINIAKATELFDSKNYSGLLNEILTKDQVNNFYDTLDTDEDYQNELSKLTSKTKQNINDVLNRHIVRLLDDGIKFIDPKYRQSVSKLSRVIKIISKTPKQTEMSEQGKLLSSVYTFEGVDVNQVEINSLMGGMTHFIFEEFRNTDADAFFDKSINEQELYKRVRENVRKYISQINLGFKKEGKLGNIPNSKGVKIGHDLFMEIAKTYKMIQNTKSGSPILPALTKKLEELVDQKKSINKMYETFFNNTEDNVKRFNELIRMHVTKMRGLGFELAETTLDNLKSDNEDGSTNQTSFNLDSTEIDQKQTMPTAIKLLIASQVSQVKNSDESKRKGEDVYENEHNYLGLPQPSEFDDVYNLLVKNLANLPAEYSVVSQKVKELYDNEKDNPHGKVLRNLAEDPNSVLNMLYKGGDKPSSDLTLNQVRLITQFVQTFSKFSPKFYLTRADVDGKIHFIDSNKNKIADTLLRTWSSNYTNKFIPSGGKYILDSSMVSGLRAEIKEASRLFDKRDAKSKEEGVTKLKNSLSKIGIDLQNIRKINEAIILNSENPNSPDDIFSTLLANNSVIAVLEANKGKSDYNVFEDDSVKGTLKKIAELTAEFSNQATDNQFISVDKKTTYAATLNHFLSLVSSRVNNSVDKGTLRQDAPHLFNVFTGNSVVRKMLEDSKINVNIARINGMIVAGSTEDGVIAKELGSADNWATTISATMNGIYDFFRAADRGVKEVFVFSDKRTGGRIKLYDNNREKALDAQLGYLLDDVKTMVSHKNGLGKNVKFYDKNGGKFRFFDGDQLTSLEGFDFKKDLEDRIEKGYSYDDIAKYINANKSNIRKSILNSYVKLAAVTKGKIKADGLLDKNPKDRLTEDIFDGKNVKTEYKEGAKYMYYKGISPDIFEQYVGNPDLTKMKDDEKDKFYESKVDELLLDFVLFQYGAYVEQSKLFVGDPHMYKSTGDFFKRMSMMNSTKKVSVMDSGLDSLYNLKNNLDIKYNDKLVPYTFSNTDLVTLHNNNYDPASLSSATKKGIKNHIGKDGNISELKLTPAYGLNIDKILSNTTYSDKFTSMIIEDIKVKSSLADDNIERIEVVKGKPVYYDKAGQVNTKPSMLRKLFTESFIKDGITDPTRLTDKVKNYLNPYQRMDEADAQAYVTMSAYKEILLKAGDWSQKHDAAYGKMMMGLPLSAKEIVLFRVLKTQYSGPMSLDNSSNGLTEVTKDNEDQNLFIPTGYKHSLFPLIPQLIKGTNLEKLNNTMSKRGIALAQMTSANKFGRIVDNDGKSNTLYDNEGNFVEPTNLITQENSFEYFGIQLDQESKLKEKITASTQWRKLALSNLLVFGVPVDYHESRVAELAKQKVNKQATPAELDDMARREWENLIELDKVEKSKIYGLYKSYQDIQRELFRAPFDKLIEELELEPDFDLDGKIIGYAINNREAFVRIANEMAAERNMSENVKSSIESLLDEDTYIEQILAKDKVENVLFAIVNSRVIKEKRKGEGAPQVAVTFFEKYGDKVENVGANGTRFSNKSLRHYRQDKDGNTLPMDCMVAIPKELIEWSNEVYGGLDGLNEELIRLHKKLDDIEVKGKDITLTEEESNLVKIITSIGFRIPNQGLQSADYMRVYRFLPYEAGDSIVVPSEMVAKAGSDFDIDKLNIYLANFKKPRKNKKTNEWSFPTYTEYSDGNTDEDVQSRYDNYLSSYKVEKNEETQSFIDQINDEAEEEINVYKSEKKEVDDANYQKVVEEFNAKRSELFKESRTKSGDDIKYLADVSKSVFNSLDYDLQSTFRKEELVIDSNLKGFDKLIDKTVQYRNFANSYLTLFEGEVDDDSISNTNIVIPNPHKSNGKPVNIPLLESIDKLKELIKTYDNIIEYTAGKGFLETVNQKVNEIHDFKSKALPEIQKDKAENYLVLQELIKETKSEIRDIIKDALLEAKIKSGALTLDQFTKLPIPAQNSKESLQNKMIEVQADIMSLPYNFRQLMSPIDDSATKNQAWELRALTTEDGIKEFQAELAPIKEQVLRDIIAESVSNIQSIITEDGKFIDGYELTVTPDGSVKYKEKDVELQQVNLTPEAQLQFMLAMAGPYSRAMNGYTDKNGKKVKGWRQNQEDKIDNKPTSSIADININMDKFVEFLSGKAGVGQTAVHITHHQLAMAANLSLNAEQSYWIWDHNLVDGQASFAPKKDMNNEWVSETLSAFVNAYVDIAKDPYVYDLGAVKSVANMMLMMVRSGASLPWVTRFISQPIIKDYIKAQAKNESKINKASGPNEELSKGDIVGNVLAKYGVTYDPNKESYIFKTFEIADGEIDKTFKDYLITKDESLKDKVKDHYDNAHESVEARWDMINEYRENGMFNEERLSQYIAFSKGIQMTKDYLLAMDPKHTFLENDKLFYDEGLKTSIGFATGGGLSSEFFDKNIKVYNDTQAIILDMFLEYQRQSKDFQMMIRATSPDTRGMEKNMDDNLTHLEEVQLVAFKNRFTNLNRMYENSIISEVQRVVEEGIMMFKPLYYFESNEVIKQAKTRLTQIIDKSKQLDNDGRSALRKTYNNDLVTAFVTSDLVNDKYSPRTVFEELFIKSDSNTYYNSKGEKAPLSEIIFELNSNKRISTIKADWQKRGGNKPSVIDLESLRGNILINELWGIKASNPYKSYAEFKSKTELESKPRFDTIQSKSRRLDVTKENDLRNAFIVIKETNKKLYEDLIRVTFNQSGIQHNSSITFSKLIPNEDVRFIMNEVFTVFDNLSKDDQTKLMNQFHDQFFGRSITYTPNIKSIKHKNGSYWHLEDDARGAHPFMVKTLFDKESGTFKTVGVTRLDKTETTRDGKVKIMYSFSNDSFDGTKYHTLRKDYKGEFRGYGRFFLGYDLSLDDKFNGEFDKVKKGTMTRDDGEYEMMMREVNEMKANTLANIKSTKPTQSQTNQPVSKSVINLQLLTSKKTREQVKSDKDFMYLFTDNTERTSNPSSKITNVDTDSWYYKKYKNETSKSINYGTANNPTSALWRGISNSYPISTMSGYGKDWLSDELELFKIVVDDEINQIKQDLSKFKGVKLPNSRIGQGGLKAKLPAELQKYLDSRLREIGIDNTGVSPKPTSKSTDSDYLSLADQVQTTLEPEYSALDEFDNLMDIKENESFNDIETGFNQAGPQDFGFPSDEPLFSLNQNEDKIIEDEAKKLAEENFESNKNNKCNTGKK